MDDGILKIIHVGKSNSPMDSKGMENQSENHVWNQRSHRANQQTHPQSLQKVHLETFEEEIRILETFILLGSIFIFGPLAWLVTTKMTGAGVFFFSEWPRTLYFSILGFIKMLI